MMIAKVNVIILQFVASESLLCIACESHKSQNKSQCLGGESILLLPGSSSGYTMSVSCGMKLDFLEMPIFYS